MSTNYKSISTCAATGRNVAHAGHDTTPSAGLYLGADSTWEQRRAFEWSFLAVVFDRQGDAERATYCEKRIAMLIDPNASVAHLRPVLS